MSKNNVSLSDFDDDDAVVIPGETGNLGNFSSEKEEEEETDEDEEEEEEKEDSEEDKDEEEDSSDDKDSKEKTDTEEEEDEEDEDESASREYLEVLSEELDEEINLDEIDLDGEDPTQPKGLAKIITHLQEKEVDKFENYIKTSFPDAYAHFITLQDPSKTTKDFIEEYGSVDRDIPSIEQLNESVDLQKNLVRADLKAKGLKASVIEAAIKEYEDDDDLFAEAKRIRDSKDADRQSYIAEKEQAANEILQRNREATEVLNATLSEIMQTGKVGDGPTIPKSKREEFLREFKKGIRIEDGKIVHAVEINPSEISKAVAKSFIGNTASLEKVIERKANTKLALRLRTQTEKDAVRSKGQKNRSRGGSVTLGEFEDE